MEMTPHHRPGVLARASNTRPPTGKADELVVDLASVSKRFGEQLILDSIDLQIRRGEFVALLGASGSGKTTLLRILTSLDHANDGVVKVTDSRTVVFQEPRLVPFNRVWTNVLTGMKRDRRNKEKALAALREVGLEQKAQRWPKSLSGGEAQRVALARALVRTPHLLLADEPFAALDALTRLRMQWLVQELWREHDPAILLVTHDVDEAVLLADRVLVLKNGRLAVDMPIDLERPRRSGRAFTEITDFLLAELGVLKDTQSVKEVLETPY
ncbi:MAG: ABC transporter ATP-binding protein [Janthinobacterium lividum]